MKIAISQITTLPADTQSDIEAFAQAGWKAVELAVSKVDKYLEAHSIQELKQELDRAGLEPVAAIGLASSEAALLLSRGDQFAEFMKSLQRQLEICRELNIKNLGIGADPASKQYEGWYSQAVENLRAAGDMAQNYDVRLGLEFMSLAPPLGPFILDDMEQTLKIVQDANHSHVGYNLDLFHFYRSGGSVEDIEALDTEKLYHVHLCDLPHLRLSELDDPDRNLPGEGVLPIEEIVRIIRNKGYDGYLSLELLNKPLWESGPVVAAEKGMQSMRRFQ